MLTDNDTRKELIKGILEKANKSLVFTEQEQSLLLFVFKSPRLPLYIARKTQFMAMCEEFTDTPYKIKIAEKAKGDEESTARQNYETMLKGMDKLGAFADNVESDFEKLLPEEKAEADGHIHQAGEAEEIQKKVLANLSKKK